MGAHFDTSDSGLMDMSDGSPVKNSVRLYQGHQTVGLADNFKLDHVRICY